MHCPAEIADILLCILQTGVMRIRTFAWQGRYRALSKDYEHTPEVSEALIRIAAIHHLLQRLRPKEKPRSQRFRFKRRPRRVA